MAERRSKTPSSGDVSGKRAPKEDLRPDGLAETGDSLRELTPEQRDAVNSPPEGILKITAGAGSGKTEVLTLRIMQLLKAGIRPEELVAITYTRNAAAEMKDRLLGRRGIDPRKLRDMTVSTFHSFLSDFLHRDPFGAGLDRNENVLADNDRRLLLRDTVNRMEDLFGAELADPEKGFGPLLAGSLLEEFPASLSRIRRFLHTPASFSTAARDACSRRGHSQTRLESKVFDNLTRFFWLYLQTLEAGGFIDFDEILIRGRALVEDLGESGGFPRQRVFLVDEFQDNNPEQLRIISSFFKGENGHLTVVGDERQSIYRFQGADVNTIRNLVCTREICLTRNFRSYSQILQLAEGYSNLLHRGREPMDSSRHTLEADKGSSPRPDPIRIFLSGPGNPSEEAVNLVSMISGLVSGGLTLGLRKRPIGYGDIAVIVGSIRNLPRSFEDAFLAREIPYIMSGGFGFYDRSEIHEILAWLRLLSNPGEDFSLLAILAGPVFRLNDSELSEFAERLRSSRRLARTADRETGTLPGLLELLFSMAEEDISEAGRVFRRLFSHLQKRSRSVGILELVYAILDKGGFHERAGREKSELKRRRIENNLSKFLGIVRSFERNGVFTTLRDFLAHVDRVLESDIEEEEAGLGLEATGVVKIMTIHKAKGLEFPVVFMPDLKARPFRRRGKLHFSRESGLVVLTGDENQGDSPSAGAFFEEEKRLHAEEEARKLYVAMTRAEELLVISGREDHSRKPDQPLCQLRNLVLELGLGTTGPWSESGKVLSAWLEAGSAPKPAPIPVIGHESGTADVLADISAYRAFLERPSPKIPESETSIETFSLQDLTTFSNCGRKFFFIRNHISPLVDSAENQATKAGTIIHGCLRLFHSRSVKGSSKGDFRRRMDEVRTKLLSLYGVEKAVQTRVNSVLARYLESDLAAHDPWLLEAELNLRIESPSGPFLVRGFADRVDREGSEIRIIDYKTHPFHPALHSSYALQMALYLAGAQRGILGDSGALNFAQVVVAYLTEDSIQLVEANPDIGGFEGWALACVESIRNQKDWQPREVESCGSCGFTVLCKPSSIPWIALVDPG